MDATSNTPAATSLNFTGGRGEVFHVGGHAWWRPLRGRVLGNRRTNKRADRETGVYRRCVKPPPCGGGGGLTSDIDTVILQTDQQ